MNQTSKGQGKEFLNHLVRLCEKERKAERIKTKKLDCTEGEKYILSSQCRRFISSRKVIASKANTSATKIPRQKSVLIAESFLERFKSSCPLTNSSHKRKTKLKNKFLVTTAIQLQTVTGLWVDVELCGVGTVRGKSMAAV